MRRGILEELRQAIAARLPVAVVTMLATGDQRLIEKGALSGDPEFDTVLAEGFRRDRSGVVTTAAGEAFVNIHNPPLRLVAIGAVHIAQGLVPLAVGAGYDVTIVDPRTAFATPERFGGVRLIAEWPDEALPRIGLDARTAFLALTHDPKIDEPALTAALASDVFYVGALGSSRTHAKRVERMKASGVGAAALARIHAPVGLDIGAVGAPEIALSIMAEVTAVLRGKPVRRT